MATTFYPFEKETVQKIDTAFDIKEVLSQDTGDMETIFVPKNSVNSETKEAGVEALRSLMAYKNPDIVENNNKTGVEQASNGSFPEFYRGADLGRADVATIIATMIADLHATEEVSKAYTYDIADDGTIVFVPRGNEDTTNAKEILNSHFDMVTVSLGDDAEGLSPVLRQQDRVVEFLTGKVSERVLKSPAERDSEEQMNTQFATEKGLNQIDALARELNKNFTLVADVLVAKNGVTEKDVMAAREQLDSVVMCDMVSQEGQMAIKPAVGEEGRADVVYQAMKTAKNIDELNRQYLSVVDDPAVRADAMETVEETETDAEETENSNPAAPNGIHPMSDVPVENPQVNRPTPTSTILDEDEDDEQPNAANYFVEYMQGINNPADSTRTSDENEVLFDAMRYMALRQTGEQIIDIQSLNAGERADSLDRAIGNLGGKKMKEYEGHLEDAKIQMLQILPPKKLAWLSEAVTKKLSKAKEGTAEYTALQTQLTNIDTRIDTIITEYANGDSIIDQSNIADAYEGMVNLLALRDSRNPTVATAIQHLHAEMKVYDDRNRLTGLSPDDDKVLVDRFEELAGKMPIDDFDIKKLGGLLKGAAVEPFVQKLLTSVQFTDKDGNVIPQTQKDTDGKDAIIDGSELDILRQISLADTLTALVTQKGPLTSDNVAQAFNDAVKNNIANLVSADMIAKGIQPTPKMVEGTLNDMAAGKPYQTQSGIMIGFTAAKNNAHMGFVNRLATKVGKESVIAKKLFAPIKGLDDLAKKRWGVNYEKAKTLAAIVTKNTARAVIMGAASKVAFVAGGPLAAIGVSAGMTAVTTWLKRREEVKKAIAQNKPIPSFGSFLKRNAASMIISSTSIAGMSLGKPLVCSAVAGVNITRSVVSTFRESRKSGLSRWKSFARSLTTIIPTAAAMGAMYFGGEYVEGATQSVMNTLTDSHANIPTTPTTPAPRILVGEELLKTPSTPDAPTGTTTPPAPTNEAPAGQRISISEENLAKHVLTGEPLSGATTTPNTGDTPVGTTTPSEPGAVGAIVEGDVQSVHHTYSQQTHDLAHARLHSTGVYDATGHHPVHQNFNDVQLNQALSSMKEITYGHAELQGVDGQSNDEILLYKLVQVGKLTGADMDLQNGQEVGEYFGVRDSGGHLHTPQSLLSDLMNGREVKAEVAAQIMGKVENGVSAEGHFLEDIKNFKEAGTWSYRPGGNPGYDLGLDTPPPVPPVPPIDKIPDPVPPVDKIPMPVPTPDIIPTPEASPWDKMLYFMPADELWKAPVLQERIGALPKKPKPQQAADKKGQEEAIAPTDKTKTGNTSQENPAMPQDVVAPQTEGNATQKTGNSWHGEPNATGNTSQENPAMGKGSATGKTGNSWHGEPNATGNTSQENPAMGKGSATGKTAPNTKNTAEDNTSVSGAMGVSANDQYSTVKNGKKYEAGVTFGSTVQKEGNGAFTFTMTTDKKGAMDSINKARTVEAPITPPTPPSVPEKGKGLNTTIQGLTEQAPSMTTGGDGKTDTYVIEAKRRSAVKLDEHGNKTEERTLTPHQANVAKPQTPASNKPTPAVIKKTTKDGR